MRDILVTAIFFGALPFVFSNPHIGVLLWSWIGYMNPHRLGWGFAYNFPFAYLIALVTFVSMIISRKKLDIFWSREMSWLLILNIWFLVTTIFSLQPDSSWEQLTKVSKIQLFIFLTLWIMGSREKIEALIWVIVASIGYYGLKGGVFTLTSGGTHHVLGPDGSFISGNTEIGLALVMILPLVWYLFLHTSQKWVRLGLILAMLLIPIAILGTQSRGALLAIGAIFFFLWLKSRKKLVPFIIILLAIPFVFMFMPQSWHDRMATIGAEEQDASARGRIQAWTFAFELASNRLVGGGFEPFHKNNYERYTPGMVEQGTGKYHDVHSIYFEMLGEHGFIGLAIFLILGLSTWINCNQVIKSSKQIEEYKWASDLTSMIQVSLIGYATGGAFLGLSYFDLPYHLLAITVLVKRILQKEISGFSNEKISFTRQFNRNNPRHGSEQQLTMKS